MPISVREFVETPPEDLYAHGGISQLILELLEKEHKAFTYREIMFRVGVKLTTCSRLIHKLMEKKQVARKGSYVCAAKWLEQK